MTRAELDQKAADAIDLVTGASGKTFTKGTPLVDLGFDSLTLVEFFIAMNEFNGVQLDDEHWSVDWTVEQMVDDIAKQHGFKP